MPEISSLTQLSVWETTSYLVNEPFLAHVELRKVDFQQQSWVSRKVQKTNGHWDASASRQGNNEHSFACHKTLIYLTQFLQKPVEGSQ